MLISAILLAFAVVLMGVKVLFVKGGKFPSGHVHDNINLRRRGITCAHSDSTHTTTSNLTSPADA